MFNSLNTEGSNLSAKIQKLDVVANNIANLNTTGFKRQSVNFVELLEKSLVQSEQQDNNENKASGVHGGGVAVTKRHFNQGLLKYTGRPLDLAIEGKGFFQITDNDGKIYYTRDGSFHVDADGRISNSQGYKLIDEELPDNYSDLAINDTGEISCKDENGDLQVVGQIELAVFKSPSQELNALGDSLFIPHDENNTPDSVIPGKETGFIRQGNLETSNVDLVMEMKLLIETQRSIQFNGKTITTVDQMWNITNNLQK
ncbi:flagellar hook-basal body protein [Desulfoscipio gibsoniae]|uniref:Flagellar hook-basal body protein n=1 Tax=Desulfoscipio gibsoniae DSM 7213 TaxID=767817 RepID=R4KPQ2_9FIRM|nr:flagellar hook-basal body complex protein [Desulfoscipio gibsoniae]AGL01636.1 flagellar hook-basal body protein [Desulfoscipio gibsoniae DSM 7213]